MVPGVDARAGLFDPTETRTPMHEVALAERMVRIALEAAEGHGDGRITSARLLLGALSCAEPETLRFAFEIAARGTPRRGCRARHPRRGLPSGGRAGQGAPAVQGLPG